MLFYMSIILLLYGQISVLAQRQVKFYYYSSPTDSAVILRKVTSANIDNSRNLKIICHGADDNINAEWYPAMTVHYLNKGYQVIAVDWGDFASSVEVINSIDMVGNLIGTYIIAIKETFDFSLDDIHFIGHSYGAHIGGYAGRLVKQVVGASFARITGLDPGTDRALKVFGKTILTATDADFVDVIHTMAGIGGIGYSVGTADFYPNGGVSQPNCFDISDLSCSHARAPWLFIESINSNDFESKKCDSWLHYSLGFCVGNSVAIMGDGCSITASGDYYLTTHDYPPYAKGQANFFK